jgi:hypothetical protein
MLLASSAWTKGMLEIKQAREKHARLAKAMERLWRIECPKNMALYTTTDLYDAVAKAER